MEKGNFSLGDGDDRVVAAEGFRIGVDGLAGGIVRLNGFHRDQVDAPDDRDVCILMFGLEDWTEELPLVSTDADIDFWLVDRLESTLASGRFVLNRARDVSAAFGLRIGLVIEGHLRSGHF